VNGYVSSEITSAIRKRAERMSMSPTRFTSLIVEEWFKRGMKKVHPIDVDGADFAKEEVA